MYVNAKARISAPHKIEYIDPLDGRTKAIKFDKVRPYTGVRRFVLALQHNLILIISH